MNPLLIKALVGLAIGAALFFGGYWRGDVAGFNSATVADATKISDLHTQIETEHGVAEKAKDDAEARVRNLEQSNLDQLAALAANYEAEIENAKKDHDRIVSELRAGTRRLRIAVAPGSCSGSGPGDLPGAGAGGRDGGQTAELPAETGAALYSIADDADNVVRQLTACQGVVLKDRATVNAVGSAAK